MKCQWCPKPVAGPLGFIADDRTGERTYVCPDCEKRWHTHMEGLAERRSEYAAKEYARCMRLPR